MQKFGVVIIENLRNEVRNWVLYFNLAIYYGLSSL